MPLVISSASRDLGWPANITKIANLEQQLALSRIGRGTYVTPTARTDCADPTGHAEVWPRNLVRCLATPTGANCSALRLVPLSEDCRFFVEQLRCGAGVPVYFVGGVSGLFGVHFEPHHGWGTWWQAFIDQRFANSPVSRVIWPANLLPETWDQAKERASDTAELFANYLASQDQPAVLFGDSLGSAVVVNTIRELAAHPRQLIQEAHITGAAMLRAPEHHALGDLVTTGVWNYHSQKDAILASAFCGVERATPHDAVGMFGFGVDHARVHDVDVTDIVGRNHHHYQKLVPLGSPSPSRQTESP